MVASTYVSYAVLSAAALTGVSAAPNRKFGRRVNFEVRQASTGSDEVPTATLVPSASASASASGVLSASASAAPSGTTTFWDRFPSGKPLPPRLAKLPICGEEETSAKPTGTDVETTGTGTEPTSIDIVETDTLEQTDTEGPEPTGTGLEEPVVSILPVAERQLSEEPSESVSATDTLDVPTATTTDVLDEPTGQPSGRPSGSASASGSGLPFPSASAGPSARPTCIPPEVAAIHPKATASASASGSFGGVPAYSTGGPGPHGEVIPTGTGASTDVVGGGAAQPTGEPVVTLDEFKILSRLLKNRMAKQLD